MTEPHDGSYTPERLRELLHRLQAINHRDRVAVARRLGITETEWRAIVILSHSGPTTPGNLGRELQLSSGGATCLINRLDEHGYIARRPNPLDKRSFLVTLTYAAAGPLGSFDTPVAQELERVIQSLSEEHRAALGAFLQRVSDLTAVRPDDSKAPSREVERRRAGPAAPGQWA
jgi:DNA-binding MarR family transcriptional regulator